MGLMHDKVVLITGAASGIGADCAFLFAQKGARCVFLVDEEYGGVESMSLSIAAKTGVECIPLKADLTKERDIKTVFDVVRDRIETLDILINCTGRPDSASDEDTDIEMWDFISGQGLRSAFLFSREAVKLMKKLRSGTIISVLPQPEGRSEVPAVTEDYSSAREGLVYLTKTMAKKAGKYGITVKGVAAKVLDKQLSGVNSDSIKAFDDTAKKEIADTVLFLASEHARYMTGMCIDVDCPLAM